MRQGCLHVQMEPLEPAHGRRNRRRGGWRRLVREWAHSGQVGGKDAQRQVRERRDGCMSIGSGILHCRARIAPRFLCRSFLGNPVSAGLPHPVLSLVWALQHEFLLGSARAQSVGIALLQPRCAARDGSSALIPSGHEVRKSILSTLPARWTQSPSSHGATIKPSSPP